MNETFIANLKRAIADREQVSIGGGWFVTYELQDVLKALEDYNRTLEIIKQNESI